ncbi:hypothetical protein HZS_5961, partial [Henneguya salminicola]
MSGSMHYFRIDPSMWKFVMKLALEAGLNTIQTYVPWGIHQYKNPDIFDFNMSLKLFTFLKTADELNLNVILRIGPFNDAELDYGGIPLWMISKNIIPRSNDKCYLAYVRKWVVYLSKILKKYLYQNGGPVIMIQVFN